MFFGVVGDVRAETYYVDSSITDTNTASATPDFTTYNPSTFATSTGSNSVFKTIADINAFSALQPGDNVLFRKGQTWREQLTVPASGTEGNVITFGAFGSGDDPKILGSSLISDYSPFKPNVDFYGSWELGSDAGVREGNTGSSNGETASSGGSGVSGPNMGWASGAGTIVDSSDVELTTGSYILKLDNNDNFQKNFTSEDSEIYIETVFRYTNNPSDYLIHLMGLGGENVAKIRLNSDPVNTVKIYNYATATHVATGTRAVSLNTWYRVKFHLKADVVNGIAEWWLEEWNGDSWGVFDSASSTGINTGSNDIGIARFMARQGSAGNYLYLDEVYINRGANDITSTTRENSPNIVVGYNPTDVTSTFGYIDYKMRTKTTTWGNLGSNVNTQSQLFISSGNLGINRLLYYYLPDLPVSNYIVEADRPGIVDEVIILNDKSYITIDGLEVGQSASSGIKMTDGEGNIVQNCNVRDCKVNCIYDISSDNFEFSNNNIYGSANANIEINASGSQDITDGLVENNISDAGHNPSSGYTSWSMTGNDRDNIIVEGTSDASHSATGVIVRNNLVKNTAHVGLFNHYNASTDWYNNIVQNSKLENDAYGGGSFVLTNHLSGTSDHTINVYNNTFWNDTANDHHYYVIYPKTSNNGLGNFTVNVKNNVINKTCTGASCAGIGVGAHSGNPLILNHGYNLFFENQAEIITYGTPNNYVTNNSLGGNLSNSTNPLFSSSGNYDFQLQYLSPSIDSGTDVGLTTDYAGNPIYGIPDIGAYEYQPPYIMGADEVDTSADVRVYGDGKFRNTETASGTTANLSIDPVSDDITQYLDVDISIWDTEKEWTETSTTLTSNVSHIVGDLEAGKYYNITADDAIVGLQSANCDSVDSSFVCQADSNGKITFTWTGGYSTHTFNVIPGDNIDPIVTNDTNAKFHTNTTSVTLNLTTSENSTCKYGSSSFDTYDTMTIFTTTGETSHSTEVNNLIPRGYTYYAICRDGVGNDTSHTLTFEIAIEEEETDISDAKLKKGSKIKKLNDDKKFYFDQKETKLKGRDSDLVNGIVKIYKEGKRIATVNIDDNGNWNKKISFNHNKTYTLKIKFYDQYGTFRDTKEYDVEVDTKNPVFTNPLPSSKSITKNEKIIFTATDNNKVDYYKIKLLDENGHIVRSWRRQSKDWYKIPEAVENGTHILLVRVYDKAGNYVQQQTTLNIRESFIQDIANGLVVEGVNVSADKPNVCNYDVEENDTLWKIAEQIYGDANQYQKIIDLNPDLNPDNLKIGQELKFCEDNQIDDQTEDINVQGVMDSIDNPEIQTKKEIKKENTSHWWNPFSWF